MVEATASRLRNWERHKRSIAVVLGPGGTTVGLAFLGRPDALFTCAHVVETALGEDWSEGMVEPLGPVAVKFIGDDEIRRAHVVRDEWWPVQTDQSGDIAVLRLERPSPEGARVLRLQDADDMWDSPCRAFGYPKVRPGGVWVAGRLGGPGTAGWVQIEASGQGYTIRQGYSGAPVWDDRLDRVIGMVVAAAQPDSMRPLAYMIPSGTLLGPIPPPRIARQMRTVQIKSDSTATLPALPDEAIERAAQPGQAGSEPAAWALDSDPPPGRDGPQRSGWRFYTSRARSWLTRVRAGAAEAVKGLTGSLRRLLLVVAVVALTIVFGVGACLKLTGGATELSNCQSRLKNLSQAARGAGSRLWVW